MKVNTIKHFFALYQNKLKLTHFIYCNFASYLPGLFTEPTHSCLLNITPKICLIVFESSTKKIHPK